LSPKRSINILIVGVGGQGVILLSDIIAKVFFKAGYNVKKSEVRGIAQRGGSVISHLRIGRKICSPLIPKGEADILIAMELLEASRWMEHLKKSGLIIILYRKISLSGISSGEFRYPTDLKNKIRTKFKNIEEVSWDEISTYSGNAGLANMFILGILSNYFSFKIRDWQRAMKENLPPKSFDLNLSAFSVGRSKFSNRLEMQKFNV